MTIQVHLCLSDSRCHPYHIMDFSIKWVSVWALYSVQFYNSLSIYVLLPHCFNYKGFAIVLVYVFSDISCMFAFPCKLYEQLS